MKTSADYEGGGHSFGQIANPSPPNHYDSQKTMKVQNYEVADFWLRRNPSPPITMKLPPL